MANEEDDADHGRRTSSACEARRRTENSPSRSVSSAPPAVSSSTAAAAAAAQHLALFLQPAVNGGSAVGGRGGGERQQQEAAAAAAAANTAAALAAAAAACHKVRRFLATIIQFGRDIGPEAGDSVRTLVLNLLVSVALVRARVRERPSVAGASAVVVGRLFATPDAPSPPYPYDEDVGGDGRNARFPPFPLSSPRGRSRRRAPGWGGRTHKLWKTRGASTLFLRAESSLQPAVPLPISTTCGRLRLCRSPLVLF